jgi:hypothetical protein
MIKQLYPFIFILFLIGCTSQPQEEHIDHIILAINDLDKGILQFKNATGVEPMFGGIHPNSYSQNALVALDENVYIEIMAPQKNAKDVPEFLTRLDSLRLIGWAVRSFDIQNTREKLKSLGITASTNREGSRAKPDGTVLSWSSFSVESKEAFPFFIQWGDFSKHPSVTSQTGCKLKSFSVTSENSDLLNQIKDLLNLKINSTKGKPRLDLSIETPKGTVSFFGD